MRVRAGGGRGEPGVRRIEHPGCGEGAGLQGGPRDRTSFARDKLSTFFYYYCASMEFIPARVGNRIAGTLVLALIAILNIIFKSHNGVYSPF